MILIKNWAKRSGKPTIPLNNWIGISFQYKYGESYRWWLLSPKNGSILLSLVALHAHERISKMCVLSYEMNNFVVDLNLINWNSRFSGCAKIVFVFNVTVETGSNPGLLVLTWEECHWINFWRSFSDVCTWANAIASTWERNIFNTQIHTVMVYLILIRMKSSIVRGSSKILAHSKKSWTAPI